MESINYIQKNAKKLLAILVCICIVGAFPSCQDDGMSDNITTEEVLQIASYIEQNPAEFSEFFRLVQDAGMYDMLNTYGVYTCFIPSNEAVLKFYEDNGLSYESMEQSYKEEIVKNHIIRGRDATLPIEVLDFPQGSISTPNMNNNFIRTAFRTPTEDNPYRYVVNDSTNIIVFNIGLEDDPDNPEQVKIHNGIIHLVDKVLEAPGSQLGELLTENPAFEEFTIFIEAFTQTGMIDSLYRIESDYVDLGPQLSPLPYEAGKYYDSPPFLRYGYTVLMENDEALARNGIATFEDLVSKVAELYGTTPEAEGHNYADRNHSLNRFVSYHILDRMQDANEFIRSEFYDFYASSTPDIYEYTSTLCPNTLMVFKNGSEGATLINKPTRELENENHVRVVGTLASTVNVMLIEISNLLYYNQEVENRVFNERMRIDAASLFSEFITNKYRLYYTGYIIPPNFFDKLYYTQETSLIYSGSTGWGDMYGDEFLFTGKFDVTIEVPPIPAGTFEFRVGYTANPNRAVSQMFFDEKPCGIPLDMRVGPADMAKYELITGWQPDVAGNEDLNAEIDKLMRNKGYMKGPTSVVMGSSKTPLRTVSGGQGLRRIVTTVTSSETKPHEFRIKSVQEDIKMQFHLDYIEIVPTSYLEYEGRD